MSSRDEIRARRQALKDVYGALYDEASRILFRYDPIGINFETNTDEYEPEVDTILPRLVTARSTADARKIVHEEFVRWFSPHDAGDEERFGAPANEIWQAHQRFAARNPAAVAKPAWASGLDLDAGRILYEALATAQRPRWAAGVLRTACSRVASPTPVSHVLEIADEPSRWRDGHKAFSAVRALTLDSERTRKGRDAIGALLHLAENAAKVVYNASGAPAPFDHDAGWWIAPCLRAVVRAVDDGAFAKDAEAALFDVEAPVPRR